MTLEERIVRIEKVANGATINGTYKKLPFDALTAFRVDLKHAVAALKARKADNGG